jgi:hypothetical protein
VRFIETYRSRFGVELLCLVMGLAPSTYYYRRARLDLPSRRRAGDRSLLTRVMAIWVASRFTQGSPRVHAQLAREGIRVGRKRVERLMREAGLTGASTGRYFRTTESDPPHGWRRTWWIVGLHAATHPTSLEPFLCRRVPSRNGEMAVSGRIRDRTLDRAGNRTR